MLAKEKARIVRRALRFRYGGGNVHVRIGKGTVSGWVYATVAVRKPSDCFCIPYERHCSYCREQINLTSKEANKIVYAAMKKEGAEFATYYAEDGYDTRSDCFSLEVRFIHPARLS